jgi:hypothetical protein
MDDCGLERMLYLCGAIMLVGFPLFIYLVGFIYNDELWLEVVIELFTGW